MTKHFVRVAAMGIAGCIALSATADTFVWQGASGGSWNEPTNWQGGVVPNASGAVADFSAASGTYTVSVASGLKISKHAVNSIITNTANGNTENKTSLTAIFLISTFIIYSPKDLFFRF